MRRDQGELFAALTARLHDAMARARATVDDSEVLTAASRLARNPASMARRCAWCGRLEIGHGWRAMDQAPRFVVTMLEGRATHSICPDCVRRLEQSGQSRPVNGGSVHGEEAGDAEPEDDHREP